jgi:hypothetical protein
MLGFVMGFLVGGMAVLLLMSLLFMAADERKKRLSAPSAGRGGSPSRTPRCEVSSAFPGSHL